eukprot:g4775.t1
MVAAEEALGICEAYCSATDACSACSSNCDDSICYWNAIPQCDELVGWDGWIMGDVSLKKAGCGQYVTCLNCDDQINPSPTAFANPSVCQDCPAGKWTSYAGYENSGPCKDCPAGQFGSMSDTWSCLEQCSSCPAGKYSSSSGSATCSACPSGQYGTQAGQTACQGCPAGQFSALSSGCYQTCDDVPCGDCYTGCAGSSNGCTTGSRNDCPCNQERTSCGNALCDGLTSCTACPAGQFQSSGGSSSCTSCPVDTYAPSNGWASGDTSCKSCAGGGTTNGKTGQGSCTPPKPAAPTITCNTLRTPELVGSSPYPYSTREEAQAACVAAGKGSLCSKQEVVANAKSLCRAGWVLDGNGYWMAKAQPNCGSAGWNDWGTGKADAYCCKNPAQSGTIYIDVGPSDGTTNGAIPMSFEVTVALAGSSSTTYSAPISPCTSSCDVAPCENSRWTSRNNCPCNKDGTSCDGQSGFSRLCAAGKNVVSVTVPQLSADALNLQYTAAVVATNANGDSLASAASASCSFDAVPGVAANTGVAQYVMDQQLKAHNEALVGIVELGSFVEMNNSRAMPSGPGSNGAPFTPQSCVAACTQDGVGYTYAALQADAQCFCSNDWVEATRYGEHADCYPATTISTRPHRGITAGVLPPCNAIYARKSALPAGQAALANRTAAEATLEGLLGVMDQVSATLRSPWQASTQALLSKANLTLHNLRNGLDIFGRGQHFVAPTEWESYDAWTSERVNALNLAIIAANLSIAVDQLTEAQVQVQLNSAEQNLRDLQQARAEEFDELTADTALLQALSVQYTSARAKVVFDYALIAQQLPSFSTNNKNQISALKAKIKAQQKYDKKMAWVKDILDVVEAVVGIAMAVCTGGASIMSAAGALGGAVDAAEAAAGASTTVEDLYAAAKDTITIVKDGYHLCKSVADDVQQAQRSWVPPGGDYNDPKIIEWTKQVNTLIQRNKDIGDLLELADIVNSVDNSISACMDAFNCSQSLAQTLPSLSLLQQDSGALQLAGESFVSDFQGSAQGTQVTLDVNAYVDAIHNQIDTIKDWFHAHSQMQFAISRYDIGTSRVNAAQQAVADFKQDQSQQHAVLYTTRAAFVHRRTELWSKVLDAWAKESRQYAYHTSTDVDYSPDVFNVYSTSRLGALTSARGQLQHKGTTADFSGSGPNGPWYMAWERIDFVRSRSNRATFDRLIQNGSATFVVPFPKNTSTRAYSVRFAQVRAYLVGNATAGQAETKLELKQLGRTSAYDSSFRRFDYTFTPPSLTAAYLENYGSGGEQVLPQYGVHLSPYGPWEVIILVPAAREQLGSVDKVVFCFELERPSPFNSPLPLFNAFGQKGLNTGPASDPIGDIGNPSARVAAAKQTWCPNNCNGNGVCSAITGACACDTPWHGSDCLENNVTLVPTPAPTPVPPTPAPLVDATAAPAQCALSKCSTQATACLVDTECEGKMACALACTTETCITKCAGTLSSAATLGL